jgi:hypothetical protein
MRELEGLERSATVHLLNEEEAGKAHDPESLRDIVNRLGGVLYPDLTPEQLEVVARRIETKMDIVISPPSIVQKDFRAWLQAKQVDIDPFYWERYRQYLIQQGMPPRVVAALGDSTEKILDLLRDPDEDGPWDRRGLVMGNVQSGKTGNYTGLICKAADAGYKVIIVIAGIHNNLRHQTQARIDEGFVGSQKISAGKNVRSTRVGVGILESSRRPAHFTSSNRDFTKATASTVGVSLNNLKEPAVFVIKKNTTTLGNLHAWLKDDNTKDGGKIDSPLLLIDDEADNASINVSKSEDVASKINSQIREILQLFSRSAYVGYTATPFANIFIDPVSDKAMIGEDLFPRSFIVSLDAPSNYMGPTKVFIDEQEQFLREINDSEILLPLKHRKDLIVTGLPESLLRALRVFVLTRAIRIARGQGASHSSMLVNASRFVDVQKHLRDEIHDRLDTIKQAIRVHAALPVKQALADLEILALRDVFNKEFGSLEFKWNEIQPLLWGAISPIRIVEINSKSSGSLKYRDHAEHGLHVVAVGGFSLSRGLTLEGLSTTYFLRNSIMYDTLLQMGRWFGYRPGYEDLCRVWLPKAAMGWYAHIAESVEELRDDLREMERAHGTPVDFGLKVRRHPDTLIVTARNKAGRGETINVEIGLGGRLVETTALLAADRKGNLEATRRFAEDLLLADRALSSDINWPGGFFATGVPVAVIVKYLRRYRSHPRAPLADPDLLIRYIEGRPVELSEWDVFAPSIGEDAADLLAMELGVPVHCQRRDSGGNDGYTFNVTTKSRVASRGVERVGLSAKQIADAQAKYLASTPEKSQGSVNYPDRIYREERTRPLLVAHLLSIRPEESEPAIGPWAAWSISFPKPSQPDRSVSYVVNPTWLREHFGEGDDGDDDLEGDDGD